jgi:PelA/Pel-15E family pectate lyase
VLDIRRSIPSFVEITHGKVHDVEHTGPRTLLGIRDRRQPGWISADFDALIPPATRSARCATSNTTPMTGAAEKPRAFRGLPHGRFTKPDVAWLRSVVTGVACVLAPASAPAAAQETELLSRDRIVREVPSLLRAAWLQYVDSSDVRERRDRAAIQAELRALGRTRATPAAAGPVFALTRDMTDDWFRTAEARRIADNVLSYQTPSGGWSKRLDLRAGPRQPGVAYTSSDGWSYVGTFDNDATTEQIRYLARAYRALGEPEYLRGLLRGVDYILEAQMPSGCWPQVYPLQGGYHDAATLNDDAMAHVLRLLRDITRGTIEVPPDTRQRARLGLERGIDCLLSSQVVVDGTRTVWCAQHDPLTLRPVRARAYEPASLSGGESVEVLEILLEIEAPDARTIHAVHAAAAWFRKTAIHGFDYTPAGALTPRAGADPIWARFYEIGTNRPLFSNRDGHVLYDFHRLDEERRTGYAWFRDTPRRVLERYARWAQRYPPSARGRVRNGFQWPRAAEGGSAAEWN